MALWESSARALLQLSWARLGDSHGAWEHSSPRLTKLFWDMGRTRNDTDRKLLLKTAPFLPLRGRNALCWQQAWSFHHGEALNKRFSNTKLFAEVITNHRAESHKAKARCLPSLRASVYPLLYLLKCHNSGFLLHLPVLLHSFELQPKHTGKLIVEAQGKTQQDAKKGKMSGQSKTVRREDSYLVDRAHVLWLQKAIPF